MFFCQAALQPLGTQSVLVPEVIIFHMQDMTFFWLSFMRFCTAHFAYVTGSLWTAAQPSAVPAASPSSVSSTNLLTVPCSRPLRKMLIIALSVQEHTSDWPRAALTYSASTLLSLAVQLVFTLLLSIPCFIGLSVMMMWHTASKASIRVKISELHSSPHIHKLVISL